MSVLHGTKIRVGILFHKWSALSKGLFGAGVLVLSCAAAPAHARTITDVEDGPYSEAEAHTQASANGADATFASLLSAWKRFDSGMPLANAGRTATFIPSGRPVEKLELTSNFGYRSDPFNGHARMHKGIDIPGPVGTPIYATADGVVSRSEWSGGYGNLVEVSHGNDMSTRYGHLSKLIVGPNERVRRGQLIGLMGSTGRSTGSHLHYEVRIAGAAVNPLPFVTGSERALALNATPPVAMGGPASDD